MQNLNTCQELESSESSSYPTDEIKLKLKSISFSDPVLEKDKDFSRLLDNLKRQEYIFSPKKLYARETDESQINFLNLNLNFNFNFNKNRNVYFSYILNMGDQLNISKKTQYIAIDLFCKSIYNLQIEKIEKIENPNYFLIAVTSLIISCKFDESDINSPFLRDFEKISYFSKDVIIKMEKDILIGFDWNLNHTIPFHFIELLMFNGIIFYDDDLTSVPISFFQSSFVKIAKCNQQTKNSLSLSLININNFKYKYLKYINSELMLSKSKEMIHNFLDNLFILILCIHEMSLFELEINKYKAASIAFTSIIIARKLFKIKPALNNKLFEMIGLRYIDISDCYYELMKNITEKILIANFSKLYINLIKLILEQLSKDKNKNDISPQDEPEPIDPIETEENIMINESQTIKLILDRNGQPIKSNTKKFTEINFQKDENLEEFQFNQNHKKVESVIPSKLFSKYFSNTESYKIRESNRE